MDLGGDYCFINNPILGKLNANFDVSYVHALYSQIICTIIGCIVLYMSIIQDIHMWNTKFVYQLLVCSMNIIFLHLIIYPQVKRHLMTFIITYQTELNITCSMLLLMVIL